VDPAFNPGAGVDQGVRALTLQGDLKVIIAGDFTAVDHVSRHAVARLEVNGGLDSGFDPGSGADDAVNVVAVRTGGRVILGGYFTSFDGAAHSRIVALATNGKPEVSFAGSGADGPVLATGLQPDGMLLLGGAFTAIEGTPRTNIARLNADGTLDPSFAPDPGVGLGPASAVNAMALQKDGKVIIAGFFTRADALSQNIARLNGDGSLDANFHAKVDLTGASVLAGVYSLAVQADGKVLLGGDFTGVNGLARTNLARLNSDGSLDTNFFTSATVDYPINAIVVQNNNKVLIGGSFGTVNGIPRNGIARLNGDGTLDNGFDPGSGADGAVYAVALQPDGKILIGGGFTHFNEIPRGGIARLEGDVPLPTLANPALSNGVFTVWVATAAGKNYALEFKNTLSDVDWNLLSTVPGDGTVKPLQDAAPTVPARFYRVSVR
jgi:uncharacterized delta-60 repeat protein